MDGQGILFVFPFRAMFVALGGLPVRRDRHSNRVEQCAERFKCDSNLVLAVSAEGTRCLAAFWRSGFYHIARRAEVPIVLGYLDYARKRGGLGPEVRPSGNVRDDMDRIRAFYADKVARHPARFTEPRLADET